MEDLCSWAATSADSLHELMDMLKEKETEVPTGSRFPTMADRGVCGGGEGWTAIKQAIAPARKWWQPLVGLS